MRNIRIADKWLLSVLAILCLALPGCGDQAHIVKVTTFPDLASTTMERIGPCLVAEYRKIPVERQFSNGYVGHDTITITSGLHRSCQ